MYVIYVKYFDYSYLLFLIFTNIINFSYYLIILDYFGLKVVCND